MAAGSKPWWNIWTLASAQAEEIVPHTIQSATEPVKGSHSQWGEIWTVVGPYKTKDDALRAIGQFHGPPPGSTGFKDKPPVAIANPLNWLQDIGHWIGEAVAHILDVHMWRSIGWLTLGAVLMVLGVFLWVRQAGPAIPLPL